MLGSIQSNDNVGFGVNFRRVREIEGIRVVRPRNLFEFNGDYRVKVTIWDALKRIKDINFFMAYFRESGRIVNQYFNNDTSAVLKASRRIKTDLKKTKGANFPDGSALAEVANLHALWGTKPYKGAITLKNGTTIDVEVKR